MGAELSKERPCAKLSDMLRLACKQIHSFQLSTIAEKFLHALKAVQTRVSLLPMPVIPCFSWYMRKGERVHNNLHAAGAA